MSTCSKVLCALPIRNVQRLGTYFYYKKICCPRAPNILINKKKLYRRIFYTTKFQYYKQTKKYFTNTSILFKPKRFKGNTKELKQYVSLLEQDLTTLTPFQFEAAIGLVLSDASLQYNNNGTRVRIKMQQANCHIDWINHLRDVFKEYTANDEPLNPLNNRPNMFEFTTLKTSHFKKLVSLFDTTTDVPSDYTCKRKITTQISKFITPVTLAYWFLGDGGRLENKGKGIEFSTHGFSEQEAKLLEQFVNDQLNLNIQAKQFNRDNNQWRAAL